MIETESERLIIRRLQASDAAFMLALLNDPDFILNIADKGVRTEAQAVAFIEEGALTSYQQYGFGPYVVETKVSGIPIGTCGFYRRDSFAIPDIGYALLPEHSGMGYALEAAMAIRNFGLTQLGFDRTLAMTSKENKRSQALLLKLGLRYCGGIIMQGYQDQSLVYLSD